MMDKSDPEIKKGVSIVRVALLFQASASYITHRCQDYHVVGVAVVIIDIEFISMYFKLSKWRVLVVYSSAT